LRITECGSPKSIKIEPVAMIHAALASGVRSKSVFRKSDRFPFLIRIQHWMSVFPETK